MRQKIKKKRWFPTWHINAVTVVNLLTEKTKWLLLLLLAFYLVGCDNKNDNDIICCAEDHFVVYKTKNDYYDRINTWDNKNTPITLSLDNPNFVEVIGTDTVYKGRKRLEGGYIMAIDTWVTDYFTDIPINKVVAYNEANGNGSYYPNDSILAHIIDKDPFVEFYEDTAGLYSAFDRRVISRLNETIRNGELETHLKRLK